MVLIANDMRAVSRRPDIVAAARKLGLDPLLLVIAILAEDASHAHRGAARVLRQLVREGDRGFLSALRTRGTSGGRSR